MEKRAFGLRKWKVLLSVFHVIFLVITLAGISAMYLNGGYGKGRQGRLTGFGEVSERSFFRRTAVIRTADRKIWVQKNTTQKSRLNCKKT